MEKCYLIQDLTASNPSYAWCQLNYSNEIKFTSNIKEAWLYKSKFLAIQDVKMIVKSNDALDKESVYTVIKIYR